MFNQVILIGNLAADPELRRTNNGKAVTTMRVATNKVVGRGEDRQEIAQFHNVVAWESLAETCDQYLTKGRQVQVVGELQHRTWEKEDGSKGYASEVVARTVNFLGRPTDNNVGEDLPFDSPASRAYSEFSDV